MPGPELASRRHVTIEVHVSVECSKDGFSPVATTDVGWYGCLFSLAILRGEEQWTEARSTKKFMDKTTI